MKSYKITFLPRLVAGLGLVSIGATSFAQDEAEEVFALSPFTIVATDEGYRAKNSVSATRINTEVGKLPVNLSVLNRDLIEDIGASDLEDVLEFVAGGTKTNASTFSGDTAITLRGFPGTPILRNGLATWNNITDTANIERVEVMKGPSSVLYGNATPGGLVNYITKTPLSEPRTSITTEIGEHSAYRGILDFTGPLNESKSVLYRLVLSATDKETFRRFEEFSNVFIAPSLMLSLGDGTSLNLNLEYDDMDMVGPRILSGTIGFPFFSNVGNRSFIFTDDPFDISYSPQVLPNNTSPDPIPQEVIDALGGIVMPENFNLGGPDSTVDRSRLTLQAILDHQFAANVDGRLNIGYNDTESTGFNINKHLPVNRNLGRLGEALIGTRYNDVNSESFFARGDLSIRVDSEVARHNIILGSEYRVAKDTFLERLGKSSTDYWIDVREFNNLPDSAFRFSQDFSNFNAPNRNDEAETTLFSLYLIDQITAFDERLTILGGVRYDNLELDNIRNGTTIKVDEVSPQISAILEIAEGVSPFVSYSTSFEPLEGFTSDGDPFKPQEGEGLEMGLRLSSKDDRIAGSIAFFSIDKTNTVINDFNINTGQFDFSQAGEESSEGIEFDFVLSPTDNWQVLFNYVSMDPIISEGTEFGLGTDANGDPIIGTTEGQPLRNAAEDKIALWTKYKVKEGPLEGFSIGGGYIKESERLGVPFRPNELSIMWPEYDRIDLMLAYDFASSDKVDATLRLNVENVADELYVIGEGYYGNPRTVTATLNLRY